MWGLLLRLSVTSLLVLSALAADPPGLGDDVLGLLVFKADLHDPGSSLASWDEDDDDACGWAGVTCDAESHRVSGLDLSGLSLSGKIGRGLLRLRSLRSLSLARNRFSGGVAPLGLDGLLNVDLSHNNLSGGIGFFFSQCRSLETASLAGNSFSGEIPAAVGSCAALASLNLSSNSLSGEVPPELWGLSGLVSVDLSENSLAGVIPDGIGQLVNLETLDLQGNQFSARVPDGIGRCSSLKSIDFSRNALSLNLPATMRGLSSCASLKLGSNSLSGEIPTWVGEMTSLLALDLSDNGFYGAVPESLSNLQLLKELNFSRNRLTGSLPVSMAACQSLAEVDLSWNSLTGKLPPWMFLLDLQRVSLSGNNLTGDIVVPASRDETLQVLDVSSNGLSGEIPTEIRYMSSLVFFNASRNSLSGSIPASLGELKWVEVVDLSDNGLNGSIPSEIGAAQSLKELALEKNSLTGGIPVQIGNCSHLTSLILSLNNLTGPIPATMANLTDLQTINLSHNKLTGTLPKELSNLPHLLSFNISHNLLSGSLPGGPFFNTIPPSSVSDNPGLCGAAANRSCPGVLPKPIVLNPNSPTSTSSSNPSSALRHKKILLSISTLVAIGAAALIALGVITITILNARVRTTSVTQSAAALVLSEDLYSRSPATDANSGKLVMFSGEELDFNVGGTHAILSKDCELGRGGFGAVYKTVLRDGRPMAIKKLTVSSMVKSQEEFEREVRKLGKVTHPNLVALQGYYWTPTLQLLIYEFVGGGSLYKHLHESSPGDALSWQERFDVIIGMARSLAHLHHHNVVHYNLKSSNVLIDATGEAKVGDYGLAKLLPMLDRYVLSSKIQSALGYMAPEFACRTVKINEKCDVYGFGVLVLEVVTGRKPVEYTEDDVVVLCDVVRGALEGGQVEECVDGKLCGRFPADEAVPVIKLGLICTSQVPSNRPDMFEVVNILEMIRSPHESQDEELG